MNTPLSLPCAPFTAAAEFMQANYGAMQRCLAAVAAATPAGASVVELYAGCGVIGLALAAQVGFGV
jgi:tRNA/tmRNA/rRNA uracil-C5-methylase (TrmA/RlmC/RlmD family)